MTLKQRDIAFEGTTIHCYEGGRGYPLLMIHGSGPGTASASNWIHTMEPLSRRYRIIAMDLIGYGLSGRKRREPYFDVEMWTRQARHVLDRLSRKGPVGIIGHSLGGFLALRTAARDRRVDKVLAQGSLGARFRMNTAIRVAWSFPKDEAAFRRLYRYVTRNPKAVTSSFIKERFKVLNRDGYGEYFSSMFKGDKQRYLNQTVLSRAELAGLRRCAIVLLHGAQDSSVPFLEATLPLARSLPHADVVRLADCGHPCSFDQPDKFLKVAQVLFG
jgi:2-hydroxymuconate-semialdehyde hydrolase